MTTPRKSWYLHQNDYRRRVDIAGHVRTGLTTEAAKNLTEFTTANNDHLKYAVALRDSLPKEPQSVTVPYDFFMSTTHVTNRQSGVFIRETGYQTFVERHHTGYIVDSKGRWSQGVINRWRLTH